MAQGNSFELAVAVQLKNSKFEFGQIQTGTVQTGISPGNFAVVYDAASFPDLEPVIQHNDQVLLGPSSNSNNFGEKEYQLVSGIEDWTGNLVKIHFKNKNSLINTFEVGDPISVFGHGLAGGWTIPSELRDWIKAEGIRRGIVTKPEIGSFILGTEDPPNPGKYKHLGGTDNVVKVGLSTSAGKYSSLIDLIDSDLIYVMAPITDGNYAIFVVSDTAVISDPLYAIYADFHKGGWRKDYAQRLRIKITQGMSSGDIFKQSLVRYGTENIRDRSLLIPYQYYRIGGRIYIDDSFKHGYSFGDNYSLFMLLRPNQNTKDLYWDEYLSITFGSSLTDVDKWLTFSTIGLLKSGISEETAPSLSIWFQNNGITGTSGQYWGDILLYIDELYAEHAGGVNYGDTDGCLKFSRYSVWPEEESLNITKFEREDITSLYGKQTKYILNFKLNYVSQDFWDQLEILLRWQEKGFLLNLHPYINDLPNTMTGKITIKELKKDSWDLGLRSIVLEFVEE